MARQDRAIFAQVAAQVLHLLQHQPRVVQQRVARGRGLHADVFVPQQQIAGIAPGVAAVVHVDSPPVAFAGVIESVGRETEFTPRYTFSEEDRSALVIRVRVRIADPQHALHAGIPAFVEVPRR